jgi:hypothetical protein
MILTYYSIDAHTWGKTMSMFDMLPVTSVTATSCPLGAPLSMQTDRSKLRHWTMVRLSNL